MLRLLRWFRQCRRLRRRERRERRRLRADGSDGAEGAHGTNGPDAPIFANGAAAIGGPWWPEGHGGRHGWYKPNYRRIGCRGGPRRSCRSARPLLSPGPLLLLPSLCATVRSCASRDTLQRSPAELQRRGALSTHRPPALSWL